jgi:N-glycosylase/DNA lyase
VYRQGDRLALHAVNYNVCLLDEARQVLDVGPTPIELPVPVDWKAAQATCYDPDAEPQTVECTVADGTVRFTLPETHVYKIVLLERTE